MNPEVSLLCLRQGDRAIEDYVADFCELCFQVDFNDVALKGIFRNGLNDFLNYLMPDSKIPVSLEQYIDHALLLSGSSYTVGIADEECHYPTVSATPEPANVMPDTPRPTHVMPTKVMPAMPKPAHVMPAAQGPAYIMPVKSKFTPVMSTMSQSDHMSANVMSATPRPVNVMSVTPKPANVKSSHLYLYSAFNNTDCVKALTSIKLEDRVSVMYNNKIKH